MDRQITEKSTMVDEVFGPFVPFAVVLSGTTAGFVCLTLFVGGSGSLIINFAYGAVLSWICKVSTGM